MAKVLDGEVSLELRDEAVDECKIWACNKNIVYINEDENCGSSMTKDEERSVSPWVLKTKFKKTCAKAREPRQ